MCRYLSREMQRSVAVSWRLSWSSGGFALSFPPSSLPTQRPVSWCFSTKTSWHRCPSTAPMSFSCCSLRLVHVQVEWRNGMYTPQTTCQLQCPLLTLFPLQFDLSQWLNEAHPVFSERTRLLELVHGALCVCGRDPEPEFLTPFHLFTKHWTWLLRHHFPDHYSDCLRLLMTSELICSEVINCDYPRFIYLFFCHFFPFSVVKNENFLKRHLSWTLILSSHFSLLAHHVRPWLLFILENESKKMH